MNLCVDASLVVKWLTPEEGSREALRLFGGWRKKDVVLFAPSLIEYEVGTALRQKVLRGLVAADDLFPIFDFYRRMDLLLLHPVDMMAQSVLAAGSLDQPTVYDIAYLLAAKQQKADFVTADQKFCRRAQPLYSFVKYYREI